MLVQVEVDIDVMFLLVVLQVSLLPMEEILILSLDLVLDVMSPREIITLP